MVLLKKQGFFILTQDTIGKGHKELPVPEAPKIFNDKPLDDAQP